VENDGPNTEHEMTARYVNWRTKAEAVIKVASLHWSRYLVRRLWTTLKTWSPAL